MCNFTQFCNHDMSWRIINLGSMIFFQDVIEQENCSVLQKASSFTAFNLNHGIMNKKQRFYKKGIYISVRKRSSSTEGCGCRVQGS